MYKLPKDHFSWSQLNTLETSETNYIKSYILGEKRFTTKEMQFGKEFAESEEENINTEAYLEFTYEGVKNIGFLDEVDEALVIEKKTGKTPWNQERVDNHGQLDFYAWRYFETYGILPNSKLIWYETEESEGTIQPTGKVLEFERIITHEDIENFKQRLVNAYSRITELMERHVPDDIKEIFEKYAKLEAQKKQLEAEQEELKPVITEHMKTLGAYDGEHYTISLRSGRKKYYYSDELLLAEAEYKDRKKEEEKTARYEQSDSSITLRLK